MLQNLHRAGYSEEGPHRHSHAHPHTAMPLHDASSGGPMSTDHILTSLDGGHRLDTEGHRRGFMQNHDAADADDDRSHSWMHLNPHREQETASASDFPLHIDVHTLPPSSTPSIEPTSSPDNEAPLSMSDSASPQPSISPPLETTRQQHQPLPNKPKLARVSSDPVPSTSSASTFTPLSFQQQPAPLPSGNRPAGTALPSHMHRQPTMDPSHHPPIPGPSNSTSRSTRYADPDSHWLSEDEGETFLDDMRHNRQSPRRRGGPRLRSSYPSSAFHSHNPDDDDNHHDGKNSLSHRDGGDGKTRFRHATSTAQAEEEQEELYVDSSVVDPAVPLVSQLSQQQEQHATTNMPPHQSHEQPYQYIPHPDDPRSSISTESSSVKYDSDTNATYRDYAPFIKDLSAITPSLLKSLTCPSCHKLMSDPTTLACGHSECLLCAAPKAASVLLRKTSPTSPPIAITAALLTEDDGNRFQDTQPLASPPLESEMPTSPSMRNPRAALADGVCPVSTCKKVTKATSHGRQGLRVDVVLQKVAVLLKNRVSLEEGDEEDQYSNEGEKRHMAAPTPLGRSSKSALLDADLREEEGSLSEPILRAGTYSPPRLSRSRSQIRSTSPRLSIRPNLTTSGGEREHGPSNTSSPDEETKSEDNAKRSMKTKSYSKSGGRSLKKSRAALSSPALMQKKRGPLAGLPMLVTDVLSELECHICVTLLYEPLTTPCGHTFCKKCLLRSSDHSNRCPLCRSELPGMSYFIHAPLNLTLSNLILTTFPVLYEQRRDLSKQEENDSGLDTAIFVCMVSFPSMPTNLHIYEPRYRLMMRRAMDSNKRFGMVLPSRQAGSGGFSQYGTMLEIRNLHVFEDGRSMVETVGVSRFKILESGTLDGYTVGRIERIDDIGDEEEAELERLALSRSTDRMAREAQVARNGSQSPTPIGTIDEKSNNPETSPRHGYGGQTSSTAAPTSRPASGLRALSFSRNRSSSSGSSNRRNSPPSQAVDPAAASANPNDASASDSVELTNAQLVDVCKGFVEALRTGSTPWLLQRLNSSLPPMPEDPREFTWWMAMLMPIDDHEKARLLQVSRYPILNFDARLQDPY